LVKIPTPTFPEQQKIASFLGSVDEWIGNLKEQKKQLEDYKRGMMQKIFSQQIRFKDENGKDFAEWEEKKLGNLGETYNGLTGKTAEDFGEGEPFITYKQIFDNSELDVTKFSFVQVSENEKQNKAQFGDVFFTTSSETPLEVGFASVLLHKNINPFLNSFSFGFRLNKNLDPYFAKFLFRSSVYRREVVKLAQGSTRYNISKIEFLKIKLTIPEIKEQQKIAELLSSVDQLLESKQQQITEAETWKKGLMQGLFI
jgi:type I restriction enzyme S subunit